MARFVCVDCAYEYPAEGLPHLCPNCGGIFTLTDLTYDPNKILPLPGIWAYQNLMGVSQNPICFLGEGQTPLVERKQNEVHFFAKLETLNPSGSFKDRNSAIVTSFLRARGIEHVVEDSSGNAGASLALYSAGFGIESQIFVPAGTAGPKINQIVASGAKVRPVSGPRENAHQAVLAELENGDNVYASHAMLPFGLASYATIAFEIYEQLGKLPDTVYCPIGHGSLFLGVLLGFKAICTKLGLESRPRMIGVQPERCCPLVDAWINRPFTPSDLTSLAEGTLIANPVRGKEIMRQLIPSWDELLSIPEVEIEPARIVLARMGIYVEPTSAMVYAALKMRTSSSSGINVLVFSGNGLKYTENK